VRGTGSSYITGITGADLLGPVTAARRARRARQPGRAHPASASYEHAGDRGAAAPAELHDLEARARGVDGDGAPPSCMPTPRLLACGAAARVLAADMTEGQRSNTL
jgi:hypothetical protein